MISLWPTEIWKGWMVITNDSTNSVLDAETVRMAVMKAGTHGIKSITNALEFGRFSFPIGLTEISASGPSLVKLLEDFGLRSFVGMNFETEL
ncbi:hypothetical protein N9021_03385, partial [Akkermansiaceae bacterium]|nr:hypothetical protein [Akkermansiaceae bacterium]